MPRVPFRSYSFHGGAGAIISAGLLQRVDAGELEKCVKGLKAPGGHPYGAAEVVRWEPLLPKDDMKGTHQQPSKGAHLATSAPLLGC